MSIRESDYDTYCDNPQPAFWDKNGVEIKEGDTIYNEHDAIKYYDIRKNEKGQLCFPDGDPLHSRYAFNRFWEVVKEIK